MGGRPEVLREVSLAQSRSVDYEVAILPWGATEPHNLHLPFGTDTFQAEGVAEEAARIASDCGAQVAVLPAVPFGANAQQLATPPTLNLNPSTQAQVLADIVQSLEHHRIRKLLVLNGHGGNDFKQIIRELQPRTSVFICCSNWWSILDGTRYFDEPGDHAGELETSVMLHLHPDLVLPLEDAGSGSAGRFRLKGLQDGVAWAPRDWGRVTSDTGVGDPRAATSEKGARFFADVSQTLADFLVELADADVLDLYEPAASDV